MHGLANIKFTTISLPMPKLTVSIEKILYTLFRNNLDSQGRSVVHALRIAGLDHWPVQCGICGGQSDIETVFPSAPYSSLSISKITLEKKGKGRKTGNLVKNRKASRKELQYFIASGRQRPLTFILVLSFITGSCQKACIS